MSYKKVVLGSFLFISLGILGGLSYQYIADETPTVNAENDNLKITSQGLQKSNIAMDKARFKEKIKLPKKSSLVKDNVLAEVTDEFSEVVDNGNYEEYHHYFIDKKTEAFIEFQVTDADVSPAQDVESDNKIKETKLSDGTVAYYLDNKIYQFLYWKQDGLSYTLVAEKSKKDKTKKFNSKELEQIASSLQ